MILKKTFIIPNKLGLHARPAALFVKALQPFRCKVLVAKDETEVNGKSLMGLMMLAAEHGSQLRVTLEGQDAPEAMKELEKLFVGKFEEP